MANIPLQSITFPGLSDKYTTPVVDNTLTQTGAAADAKKTGDEIAELKNDLSELEAASLFMETDENYIVSVDDAISGTKMTIIPPSTAGNLVYCGKNLFDQSQFLKNTSIVYQNGYYNGMGSYFTNVVSLLELPKFKPYVTYIASFTAYASAAMQFKFGWVYDDGTTRWSSAVNTTETTITFASTPDAYINTGTAKTIVGINFTYSSSGRIYIKNFQIVESRSSVAYEEFKGTVVSYSTDTPVELEKSSVLNTIYCTGGKCTVSYYRKKIGIADGEVCVCLGDSLTGNYTEPTDYPSYMHNYIGVKAINGGFGGTRMSLHTDTARQKFSFCSLADAIVSGDFSAQITAANNIDIYNVYEHIENLANTDFNNVDFLVVFYGTNDFTAQVPIDNQDDPQDRSTYLGAFRYGISKILEEYPNIKILAVTPIYRYFTNTQTDSDSQQYGGKYLYEFGDALIECCKEFKTPSLDLYHVSGINSITKDYYLEDNVHPTTAGRKNIANVIAGTLLQV